MAEHASAAAHAATEAPWRFRLIDLTRPITEETAYAQWGDLAAGPRGEWFRKIEVEHVVDFSNANASACQVAFPDHSATHVDAPVHTVEGAPSLEQMDIARLIGEAVVLDVRDEDPDHGITPEDLARATPEVRAGDIVLLYAGHVDADEQTRAHQHYLTPAGAEWLVERGVKSVGVESLGIEHIPDGYLVHRWPEKDTPNPPSWPAHGILLRNDVYIIEGLTNLAQLRGRRVRFAALPLLFPGLTGCPVRAVAWEDEQ